MPNPSVIVIEDEKDLCGSMCAFLAAAGFDVRGAGDGVALDLAWAERPADILVIDVNLPGEDGFSIAKRMRRLSAAGIIMLTARAEAADRITGLEAGADNYLVKPVVLRELAAAVKGLARRLDPGRPDAAPAAWSFDPLDWSLRAPGGRRVTLTTAEFGLVETLVAAPGTPVPAEDILQALGKPPTEANRRGLDSTLSRLRRKVERATGQTLPVKSVRSVGYVFAAPAAGKE